jgi:hypothetical protein
MFRASLVGRRTKGDEPQARTLRRWETLGASSVYDCRVFSVTEHRRRSPRTGGS